MEGIKVGVVGCGNVADRLYFPGFKFRETTHKELFNIIAVCDEIEDRARNLAQKFNIGKYYTEYKEMLGNADIDLVVNLTPIQAHASCTLEAIAAGKHVYIEKPIATTLIEADNIIEASREARVKIACAPPFMLHPETKKLRALIQEGAIGKICFIRARASHPGVAWWADCTTDPSWCYKEYGGPVFDLAVYPLQIITGILGPAKRVIAFSGKAIPERIVRAGPVKGKQIIEEIDDNTHIMLDFGEAVFAILDATYCVLSARGPRMELYGSKGVINLYSGPDKVPMRIFRDEVQYNLSGWLTPEPVYRGSLTPNYLFKYRVPDTMEWTFADGVLHLAECIKKDSKPLLSGEHARHVLEIMVKTYESAKKGCAVNLNTCF